MDFSVTVSPFIHDEAMENVTFNNSRGIRIDLPVSRMHLHLEYCLMGGQAFHWVLTGIKQWSSAIGNYLVTLFEVDDRICFSLHSCENCLRKLSLLDYQVFYDFFVDYFRLNISLPDLVSFWQLQDPHFAKLAIQRKHLNGVRVLRQDPFLTLLSFICSANNNIGRISKMVLSLGKQYGSYVCSLEGIPFYTFPKFGDLYSKLETLESDLRHLGFGYRASYLAKTILALHELPLDSSYLMHPSIKILFADAPCPVRHSLYALREREYSDCLSALLPLAGIGRKVADCICLFSLDKLQCIPIDVHVWRISLRDYKLKCNGRGSGRSSNAGSSLTPKVYQDITDFYKDLFKFYVGWAHTLLFVADLGKFNKL